MDYVMVPVPEELAEAAKQFLMARDMLTRAATQTTNVDTESALRLVPLLNPSCRAVLSILADAALEQKQLTIGDLAAIKGWSAHETAGVVHELRELVWGAFGPVLTVMPIAVPDSEVPVIDWNEQKVFVWKELAVTVVDVEQQLAEGA